MLPGAVIGAFMGLVSGRLFDRFGVRKVVVPGSLVALFGAFCLTLLGMDTGFVFIMLAYTILTIGLQFTMTPLNTWGVNSLPNDVIQHAQGLSNTLNQVAASLGTAVLVSISALAPVFAPESTGIKQMFIGDHMAFTTTAVIMVIAVLVILFFVRDKAREKGSVEVEAQTVGEEPVDYATGFDGVTVDTTASENIAVETGASREMQYHVSDAMNRNPLAVLAGTPMDEVIELMAANDTSGVPVVDEDDKLVGFISDGDVASYLGSNNISLLDSTLNIYRFEDDSALTARLVDLLNLDVMDIATKRVISVREDTPLDKAVHTLSERRIKKMPVIDGKGRLVGALSRRNVMHAIAGAIDELKARS